jgi:hypothetical protein
MARGGSQPGERRGGRKKGSPNKLTAKLKATLAEAAQQHDGQALHTLEQANGKAQSDVG